VKDLAWTFIAFLAVPFLLGADSCDRHEQTTSDSGIQKASVKVPTDPEGFSIEQRNIMNRLLADNKPGSVKHLYVISAMSGQVLIYSTVKGKVTSSHKRLSPKTVASGYSNGGFGGLPVTINGGTCYTGEILGDDGSYGDSSEYIFWWDVRGVYHQHYIAGGQILHISDQPMAVKEIVLNMETAASKP